MRQLSNSLFMYRRFSATPIDGAVIASCSIHDAGCAERPRVLLADDHPANAEGKITGISLMSMAGD